MHLSVHVWFLLVDSSWGPTLMNIPQFACCRNINKHLYHLTKISESQLGICPCDTIQPVRGQCFNGVTVVFSSFHNYYGTAVTARVSKQPIKTQENTLVAQSSAVFQVGLEKVVAISLLDCCTRYHVTKRKCTQPYFAVVTDIS